MNALLAIEIGSAEYFANLGIGIEVFLIGIITVFAVLSIILGILTVFNLVFNKQKKEPQPTAAPAPAPVVTKNNDDEIIAVIAAAIAAAESECGGMKFTVVSFKRM